MNQLENARIKINDIDKKVAELFEERMKTVREVAEYKKAHGMQIFDATREKALIEKNQAYIKDDTLKTYYVRFLQDMMDVSKQYQHQLIAGARIAYAGIEGAYANIAARKIFPDGNMVSFPSFSAAYEAVVSGDCEFAVLPIENSFAGEVGQVMDLMFSGNLYVSGVYSLKVSHNLLALKGTRREDIKKVISHPQALSQCAKYIEENGYEVIQSSNTAKAAKQVSELGDKTIAAIASSETAELYDLEVLDHDINESDWNATKFAVFSRVGDNSFANKNYDSFMMMFTVKNEAGALADAISTIGKHGVNMRVLRSRPLKGLAWQYYFYVEADAKLDNENGRKMMDDLKEHCEMLKILGSYPIEGTL